MGRERSGDRKKRGSEEKEGKGRAAERIVGALGKYKSGPMGEGGLGACHQENLRFYML